MRLLVFILFVVAVLLCHVYSLTTASGGQESYTGSSPLNILVVTPGAAGHSRLLVRLIRQLHSRGHNVTLLSDIFVNQYSDCSNIQSTLVPLDQIPLKLDKWDDVSMEIETMDLLEAIMEIFRHYLFPVDAGIVQFLRGMNVKEFHVAVLDMSMVASRSYLMNEGVPTVVNFPSLYTHGVNYPPSFTKNPISIHDFVKYPQRIIAHFRAVYETLYPVFTLVTNEYTRDVVNLNVLAESQYKSLHVVTNTRGFDYQSAVASAPNIHFVGPVIDLKQANNETYLLDSFPELSPWLERYGSSDIAYVAFGTTGTLSNETMSILFKGLVTAYETRNISSLVVLRDKNYRTFISLQLELPDSIFVTTKFVPQVNILALPSVKYFITHCGLNSAQEGLYFGKQLIGMPFSFDQYKVAQLLEDNHLGVGLYKSREEKTDITVEKLLSSFDITSTDIFRSAVQKQQKIIKHSGGLERYVSLVEMMGDIGDIDHLQVDPHYNFIQSTKLDLIAFYLLIFYAIFRILKAITCCCCGRSKVQQKHKYD